MALPDLHVQPFRIVSHHVQHLGAVDTRNTLGDGAR